LIDRDYYLKNDIGSLSSISFFFELPFSSYKLDYRRIYPNAKGLEGNFSAISIKFQ